VLRGFEDGLTSHFKTCPKDPEYAAFQAQGSEHILEYSEQMIYLFFVSGKKYFARIYGFPLKKIESVIIVIIIARPLDRV